MTRASVYRTSDMEGEIEVTPTKSTIAHRFLRVVADTTPERDFHSELESDNHRRCIVQESMDHGDECRIAYCITLITPPIIPLLQSHKLSRYGSSASALRQVPRKSSDVIDGSEVNLWQRLPKDQSRSMRDPETDTTRHAYSCLNKLSAKSDSFIS